MTPPERERRSGPAGVKLFPLSDAQWRHITAAIGGDVAHVRLRGGASLRDGFELAISVWFEEIADGPLPTITARHAEVRRFVRRVRNSFLAMSPHARALWDTTINWPSLSDYLNDELAEVEALLTLAEEDKDRPPMFDLMVNTCWLIRQIDGVAMTLPSKGYGGVDAERHPLYRTTRAVLRVTAALAEAHAPQALPVVAHVRDFQPTYLIERIRKARGIESLLPEFLDDGEFFAP